MKKSPKSFEIALSAIACAIATAFLMLGTVSPFLLMTGYLVAAFAVMVPLSMNFYRGAFLCYLAAGLIALPLGLWKIVPYAVFFGLHPIVNRLQKNFVKKKPFHILCEIGKVIWFDFSLWLSYYILTAMSGMVFPKYIEEFLFLVIFPGGTLIFAAYDVMIFYCQKSADIALRRIRR